MPAKLYSAGFVALQQRRDLLEAQMPDLDRRSFLIAATSTLAASAFGGVTEVAAQFARPDFFRPGDPYGPVPEEPFPIPALRPNQVKPGFFRTKVSYETTEMPGTVVVDPHSRYLYSVQEGGWAVRYGVGVGRSGFAWAGTATIEDKQEWPDWYPPKEMLARQPELMDHMVDLQGGIGMPGGPGNPLGARAMYLWQGGKDTLYRIHGTSEPWTIGSSVSSGCIRMINQDAIDLYARTPLGTKVVVLGQRTQKSVRQRER
jgi:lipoprotein-anchoring transpeptidase ErfK/SrfK